MHHVRLARPVRNLEESARQYVQGLGLSRLGAFQDHDGFDGVMVGKEGGSFHFEFTFCGAHPVMPTPTPEDLVVFYIPDSEEWTDRCQQMIEAGFEPVTSLNPYWDVSGQTFEDSDGYRVVIQNSGWTSQAVKPLP